MAADTRVTLTQRMPIENHQTPGVFGVTSRFPSGVIAVTWNGAQGAETAYLRNAGDSLTLDLLNIDQIVIAAMTPDLSSESYPADVLILQSTTGSAILTAAPVVYTGAGGGAPYAGNYSDSVSVAAAVITHSWVIPDGYRVLVDSLTVSYDVSASSMVAVSVGGYWVFYAVKQTKGTFSVPLGAGVLGDVEDGTGSGAVNILISADTGTITADYAYTFGGSLISGV